MGIFDKFKTKDEPVKKVDKPEVPAGPIGEEKPVETGESKVVLPKGKSASAYGHVINPHITEKSSMLGGNNQYVFKVTKGSAKQGIKKAVEELYNVEVERVNIVNLPAKKRRLGRQEGIKSGFKKAVITLKEGNSIQLN